MKEITGPIHESFSNTSRPRWNGQHFADDIFKRIFFNENVLVSIRIALNCVQGPINNIPALVQIMVWCWTQIWIQANFQSMISPLQGIESKQGQSCDLLVYKHTVSGSRNKIQIGFWSNRGTKVQMQLPVPVASWNDITSVSDPHLGSGTCSCMRAKTLLILLKYSGKMKQPLVFLPGSISRHPVLQHSSLLCTIIGR